MPTASEVVPGRRGAASRNAYLELSMASQPVKFNGFLPINHFGDMIVL